MLKTYTWQTKYKHVNIKHQRGAQTRKPWGFRHLRLQRRHLQSLPGAKLFELTL